MRTASTMAGLWIPALFACVTTAADARNVTYGFDIPARSLNESLQALALASNFKLLYSSELVAGKNAPAIKGEYTPEQAVQILLANTDLTYEISGDLLLIRPKNLNAANPLAIKVSQTTALTSADKSNSARTPYQSSSLNTGEKADDLALEEIVVTAEHRSEDIQKTAASVSVRSGNELTEQGKYQLSSILEDIPGIVGGAALNTGTSLASGTDNIASGVTIRGIQSNVGAFGTVSSAPSAAAIYVDGVYSGVGGDFDIQRIETLRGPQGTLYGRSATSGVIAIHTQNPHLEKFEGNVQAELGNYALQHYSGAVNLPIVSDTLALRVSANEYKRNGYYSPDGGAMENTEARAKLLYQPTNDLSILLGFALDDNITHTGGTNASVLLASPNTYAFSSSPLATGNNSYRQYWAEVNWNLGPATLTYIPAVRTWKSQLNLHLRSFFQNVDQNIETPSDNFVTNELRLASNPGATVTWQVGTLIYKNDVKNRSDIYYYPSGAISTLTSTQRATEAAGLFSEATYPLTQTWRLTGGLRYDYTKVATNQRYTSNTNQAGDPAASNFGFPETLDVKTLSGSDGTRQFRNWTYKARVEHDLAPSNLVYAMVSSGFSPGDLSITRDLNLQPIVVELKSETLHSYEAGTKNRFLDNRLQINADLFYASYGGYQTASINISANPAISSYSVLSAGVRSWGAEFELLYQMTTHDRVGLNIGYIKARFVDKSRPVPGTPYTFATFFAKDDIPGIVPLNVVVSYDRTVDLPRNSKLTLHADVRMMSRHDEGRITAAQLQAGTLLAYVDTPTQFIGNVSATWSSANDRYSLTGYVRNVGDNEYKTNVNTSFGLPQILATPYDPRTYGISAGVKW